MKRIGTNTNLALNWGKSPLGWQSSYLSWLKSPGLAKVSIINSLAQLVWWLIVHWASDPVKQLKKVCQAILYLWNRTGSPSTAFFPPVWLFLQPVNSCLFLHSFVPLKSLMTETSSSAWPSTVARLVSQNDLKWLHLCQESYDCFSFFGEPNHTCLWNQVGLLRPPLP